MNLFTNANTAKADWQKRYSQELREKSEDYAMGDDAFIFHNRTLGVLTDNLIVEFTVKGDPALLKDFSSTYYKFIQTKLK